MLTELVMGVGFFLNVHEGPQSISKSNNVKIIEG